MLTAVPTAVTRIEMIKLLYTMSVEKIYLYASSEKVVGIKMNFFEMTSSTVAKEAAITWMNGSTQTNPNPVKNE